MPFRTVSKQRIIDEKLNKINGPKSNQALNNSLDSNISLIKNLFVDNDMILYRYIDKGNNARYCIIYAEGVVDPVLINNNIIKPLMLENITQIGSNIIEIVKNQIIQINEMKLSNQIKDIIDSITYGDTLLFIDGSDEFIILNTKGYKLRPITEPDSEKIISGPREGFNENLIINLSMIIRKVRTNELKIKYRSIGKITNTKICICYIDSVVNKKILDELNRRLDKINIDSILDVNYIYELIRDSPMSPFRTAGITERPDVIAGKLLEGRIALFIDGSPVVMTLPYLFIENFQSSEDYYLSPYYTSFSRFLRMTGFFLTISVPSIYVAIVAFHHEILPTPLLINIASDRASVPLPDAIEAFIMLIVFDVLRETGIRMPSNAGQTLSIVGALVIGQAAVEARLVAAPMIIIVATTGITSLLIPKLNAPIILIRFALLLISSIFGLYGFVLGFTILFIHLLSLRSFGISQMSFDGNLRYQEVKDTFIRAPWWNMIERTKFISGNRVRLKPNRSKKA